ncbi:MAG: PilW family protein, partial [Gammaproteobacteria bacterium]|nr:PilW family protein [Gammaproteobacteria bacterium]
SIFLLGGVIQVYTGNKASYGFSEAMSRIQENGRFAMDTITRDLRMAGFMGCATFDPTDSANVVNNTNPNGAGYSELYDFLDSPAIKGINENEGENGSDTFELYGPVPSQTNITQPYAVSTSANIKVTSSDELAVGDIVLLTNCKGADIFQITNLTAGGGTDQLAVVHNTGTDDPGNYNPDACQAGQCLSQVYGGDAALLKLQKVTYTIEAGESGEPALFRTVFNVSSELVEGIDQMQVLYGLNTDPDTTDTTPNQYLPSNLITTDDAWNSVTAVRVMLLVRSDSNVSLESPQTYSYNGVDNITANDNKLRQVFSATIAIRNRI